MTPIQDPDGLQDKDLLKIELDSIQCDVCDKYIPHEDLCTLYIQGVKEKLSCHSKCIEIFYKCKGDFTKLPSGRLKRSIFKTTLTEETVKNTGITIREKQGRHIIDGLKISVEEGAKRIHDLAVIFYMLPEPNLNNHEFYSIDERKQLVLKRKIIDDNSFKILEASRE